MNELPIIQRTYDLIRWIVEPKRRLISAAPYRDRVVHHALCNIIVPLIEPSFVYDSYANRVGKGSHRALERFIRFARSHRFPVMSVTASENKPGRSA